MCVSPCRLPLMQVDEFAAAAVAAALHFFYACTCICFALKNSVLNFSCVILAIRQEEVEK